MQIICKSFPQYEEQGIRVEVLLKDLGSCVTICSVRVDLRGRFAGLQAGHRSMPVTSQALQAY